MIEINGILVVLCGIVYAMLAGLFELVVFFRNSYKGIDIKLDNFTDILGILVISAIWPITLIYFIIAYIISRIIYKTNS